MKQKFLAVYDYRTGGLWAVVNARSSDEIVHKYPFLEIVETRPAWMTQEIYEALKCRFDIDDPPIGWLLDIMREKGYQTD